MRTWSSASGNFSIDATLIEADGNSVVLEKKDGEQITVPVDQLSDDCQAYVNQR